MNKTKERRKEERLQHHLPVWFSKDPNNTATQGIMVDISTSGMAFSCNADENLPYLGQRLTTRFSLPHTGRNRHTNMKSFTRTGRVSRVESISDNLCRVAIQFDDPPPFWDLPPTIE